MRKIYFLLIYLFLCQFLSYSEVYLAGRGSDIDSYLWEFNEKKNPYEIILAKRGENFSILKDEKNRIIYSAGALNNNGIIWEYNLINKTVSSEYLSESRVIYSLAYDPINEVLYAAGVHEYLGGYIWKKEKNSIWEKIGSPEKSSMITSILVDDKGRVFIAGLAYSNGVIWILDKGVLTNGTILNNAVSINVLLKTKNKIYAAGKKKNQNGGIWGFDGNSWKEGNELKFSNNIYTGAVDNNDIIYLAGAGDENKVLWENSKGFWNAVELKECLAIYAFYIDNKSFYVGGWNKNRKGRVWHKSKNSDWNEGLDIPNCFVIRAIN